MKKCYLWMLTAILLCGSLTVQAQEEEPSLVVTEGTIQVLKQKGKTGTVEFDYDHAKVGDLTAMNISNETLLEFLEKNDEKAFRKWNKYKEEGKETFIDRWNDEKKKCVKLIEDGPADYNIKVKADYIDTGNAGAATWSWNRRDGGIMITGTLEVFDANGTSVCKVKINRYRGRASRPFDFAAPFSRRVELFHKGLARDLLILILG